MEDVEDKSGKKLKQETKETEIDIKDIEHRVGLATVCWTVDNKKNWAMYATLKS